MTKLWIARVTSTSHTVLSVIYPNLNHTVKIGVFDDEEKAKNYKALLNQMLLEGWTAKTIGSVWCNIEAVNGWPIRFDSTLKTCIDPTDEFPTLEIIDDQIRELHRYFLDFGAI